MKILLDENVTRKLIQILPEHDVYHIIQMKWRGVQNGALLKLMEDNNFDIMITLDSNIPYQQSFSNRSIALLVLQTRKQGAVFVLEMAEQILKILPSLQPGTVHFLKA